MSQCPVCKGFNAHYSFCAFGFSGKTDLNILAQRWLDRAEGYTAENRMRPSEIARTNALRWEDAARELDVFIGLPSQIEEPG